MFFYKLTMLNRFCNSIFYCNSFVSLRWGYCRGTGGVRRWGCMWSVSRLLLPSYWHTATTAWGVGYWKWWTPSRMSGRTQSLAAGSAGHRPLVFYWLVNVHNYVCCNYYWYASIVMLLLRELSKWYYNRCVGCTVWKCRLFLTYYVNEIRLKCCLLCMLGFNLRLS